MIKNTTYYRAYALFYERILDLKTVINTPVNSTPDKYGIYNETSSGALVSHYEKVYDGSRNLFLEDNNFYLGSPSTTNKFEFQPDTDESGKPVSVNSKNQFIYKINSLDMTKVDSLFFSIRVEKMYSILSQNVEFNLSPGHDGRMLFENTSGSELTGNGKINGDDYTFLSNVVKCSCNGIGENYLKRSDLNGDGTIDAFDVIYLDLYLNGKASLQ